MPLKARHAHGKHLGLEHKGRRQKSYQPLNTSQENCGGRDRGPCHTSAEVWMVPKIYLLDDGYK